MAGNTVIHNNKDLAGKCTRLSGWGDAVQATWPCSQEKPAEHLGQRCEAQALFPTVWCVDVSGSLKCPCVNGVHLYFIVNINAIKNI